MPEARSDLHPRPGSPATPPRRTGSVPRPGQVNGRARTFDPQQHDPSSFDGPYSLDPPLVDVRIPVKAPHATATAYSRNALMHRYPEAEVGDDLHILFREPSAGEREGLAPRMKEHGKPLQSRLSPDVFVALDVPRRTTRSDYDVDRLGPPDFVLEVVSKSTWQHDVGRKLDVYQRLGVRECLLFDSTGMDWAGVGKDLWGFALTVERREPLGEVLLPNGERGVRSAVLGLVAYVAERTGPSAEKETWALTMRWRDPATGTDIPDYDQSRAREAQAWAGEARARAEAQAERAKAQEERARAEAAEHRVAELEEQLRRRGAL